ncbi:MAG TPA: hypothetical protein VK528_05400 [Flavobacterium sp.]|nr:hypothetical protein [Flavobacterium sp.]
MKKVLLTAIAIFAIGFTNAQDMHFGVKAGLFASSYDGYALHRKDNNGFNDDYYYNSVFGGAYDSNTSNVGFYAGGLIEIAVADKFKVQPELTFSIVPGDDGYLAVNVPVMVKYSFFDKFYAQAGPALNYAVDGDDDQFSPSFDLGASYDIMQNFYVEVRADIGIAGYLGTNINAGVGYRF